MQSLPIGAQWIRISSRISIQSMVTFWPPNFGPSNSPILLTCNFAAPSMCASTNAKASNAATDKSVSADGNVKSLIHMIQIKYMRFQWPHSLRWTTSMAARKVCTSRDIRFIAIEFTSIIFLFAYRNIHRIGAKIGATSISQSEIGTE